MNLTGKINLLKLESSGLVTINGRSGSKLCVVIPVDDNDIYVSLDEATGKVKGAYIGLNLYENSRTESGLDQYGNSHSVKQRLSKAYRETHTEEEIKAKPYLGNMQPMPAATGGNVPTDTAVADVADNDDLPF